MITGKPEVTQNPERDVHEAGDYDLGTIACNCPCHKKPENEVPQ